MGGNGVNHSLTPKPKLYILDIKILLDSVLEHFLFYCRRLRASLNHAWAFSGVILGK